MRTFRGFTLIELMIVVAVIALLAVVAYPAYLDHLAKSQRSQGQQLLSEIAQRQEQYLLDRRQYATSFGAGGLGLALPAGSKYDAPDFTGVDNGGTPPVYRICMNPATGSALADRNDGRLCINSQGQQWREAVAGNGTFDAGTDCAFTDTSCKLGAGTGGAPPGTDTGGAPAPPGTETGGAPAPPGTETAGAPPL